MNDQTHMSVVENISTALEYGEIHHNESTIEYSEFHHIDHTRDDKMHHNESRC